MLRTLPRPAHPTLLPYTTLFRSGDLPRREQREDEPLGRLAQPAPHGSRPGNPQLGLRNFDPLELPEIAETELRSEEHTSELQSRRDLVCRLLLEKKKITSGYMDE